MTDRSTQGVLSSDNTATSVDITSSAQPDTSTFSAESNTDTSTSNTTNANPTSHSALFGLTGQSSPTKFAGSGPGSGVIGTSGVKGKHNSVSTTDGGGLTGGKMGVEVEKGN